MDGPLSNPFTRHPQHHQSASHESSSVSSHSSPQNMIPPPSSLSGNWPPVRPLGLSTPAQHPYSTASPSGSLHAAPYGRPYATSTSPSTTSGSVQDHVTPNEGGYSGAGVSPTHLSASLNAQKRAYRQRRKDPSCDACRERKVKCDATETSSCSECSTRSVKCQFTKETNRRMSSIKQVQDLQSQLADSRHHINQLEMLLRDKGILDSAMRAVDTPSPALALPEVAHKAERGPRPRSAGEFSHVRKNVRIYSRGIFKTPAQYRLNAPPLPTLSSPPTLPPKQQVDPLLANYYGGIHIFAPVLHWRTFHTDLESVYAAGSLRLVPQVWVALFFAVLACGTLRSADGTHGSAHASADGDYYLGVAVNSMQALTDDFTVDHCRAAFLISTYLHENGLRSAASLWLGNAVRIAQDLGLQYEQSIPRTMESELLRRIWWTIYSWDRLLSLETGRPLFVDDEDCDLGNPNPIDDNFMMLSQSQSIAVPHHTDTATFQNMSVITPVVRFVSQLKRTLKAGTTASLTLQEYDDYFRAVMESFPQSFHLNTEAYLDPSSLFPALTLQIARFHLYRQNLSMMSSPAERVDALGRCVSVAIDTVAYINRTLQKAPSSPELPDFAPPQPKSWHEKIAASATSLLCTHVWRCMLILCLRCDFHSALVCLRVSAAVGGARKVNIACGRNLAFFLDRLTERFHSGSWNQQLLEQDEEMLAYVSGDIQGISEMSWIWSGGEMSSGRTALTPVRPGDYTSSESGPMDISTSSPVRSNSGGLTEGESQEWGGWERIERMMTSLMQAGPGSFSQSHSSPLQQQRHPFGHAYNDAPPQSLGQRPHAQSERVSQPLAQVSNGRPPTSGSSKMRISDII